MSFFEDFIHPVDADRVVRDGNHQHRKDAVWTTLKESSYFLHSAFIIRYSLFDSVLHRYAILLKITMT